MIALKYSEVVATLALLVALGSAYASYRSSTFTERQAVLADIKTRPYVRYRPIFEETRNGDLRPFMLRENLSDIPARTIYDELRTWVDGVSTGAFLINRTGDALYQHHNGRSDLQPLPRELSKAASGGKVKIMVGTCIVYSSVSPSDSRRWEVRALYSYQPHTELPNLEYMEELFVEPNADHCDSKGLWSQWALAKQQSTSSQSK
jgi:hypothetical protein